VGDFDSCAVCGRTLLRGEHAAEYVDGDGDRALVCPLCKQRAEASGWVPAALASTVSRYPAGRRRVGAGLRARLARAGELAGARIGNRPEPAEPEAPPSPPRRMTALQRFNAHAESRKVAGLVRSLGEPQATVRGRAGAKLITVAWELTWYQWEVHGEEVREVAHGREISELDEEDRAWNATVGEDGTIRLG
jgi:hypothetical protein